MATRVEKLDAAAESRFEAFVAKNHPSMERMTTEELHFAAFLAIRLLAGRQGPDAVADWLRLQASRFDFCGVDPVGTA